MNTLPEWLLAKLQDEGKTTSDGIGRAARYRRCEECQRWVLRGLDDDRAALVAVCDPTELDALGELFALALNLRTYTLTRGAASKGMAWNLNPRDQWQIAAGTPAPLVAQHRCGVALPRTTKSLLPTIHHSSNADDRPPF
jgi:hypothetical protein